MSTVTRRSEIGGAWAKVKFLWDYNDNLTLSATSEASGYEVENMLNRLESNYWKSALTSEQYITDIGGDSDIDVDYICLYDHNLYSGSATVTLQYSSDNFASDVNDAFTGEVPTSDNVFYKEFDLITADYWRIKISASTVAPQITIGYWGVATELDWCTVQFDPNQQENKDVVNVSNRGYVLGVYVAYTERLQTFTWSQSDLDLYDKLAAWFEGVGRQNFFTAWDTTAHADEIYLMYSADGKLNNPYTMNGKYRDMSVNLKGRKL